MRHILCEKLSKANEALQKLKQGDRFDKVRIEVCSPVGQLY